VKDPEKTKKVEDEVVDADMKNVSVFGLDGLE